MGHPPRTEVVAIDGPSGAGKSTVAREIASRLGYVYLDTGAMYRAVTLHFLRRGVDVRDAAAVRKALDEIDLDLDEEGKITLNEEDVTREIRSRAVTAQVSASSALPAVRRKMVALQRAIARRARGVVAEGRDTTTVVFPKATAKFYLDASLSERARRRASDFLADGEAIALDEVEDEMAVRDRSDASRKTSPLRRAEDAIAIDTTETPPWAVVQRVLEEIERRRRAGAAAETKAGRPPAGTGRTQKGR
ncbi:MAG TPA: (d)CMP kinase [Planctomycetota bacterium]|nr:(d)CMP kinase [Planctomycetota bacterium]